MVVWSILIGILAAGLNLTRPILFGMIINVLVNGDPNSHVFWLILLFLGSWLATWGSSLLLMYVSTKISQRILMSLRVDLFAHFLRLPFTKIEEIDPGKIQAYHASDLPRWTSVYGTLLAEVTHSLAQFIGSIIALSYLDANLMLWLLPFLILSASIPIVTSKSIVNISHVAQEAFSSTLETLSSLIKGSRDLISVGANKWGENRFKEACNSSYRTNVKRDFSQGFLQIVGSAIEILAYILILYIGGSKVLRNEMAIGELISFLATIEMIFFPARHVNHLVVSMQNSFAAAKRVIDFLDIKERQPSLLISTCMYVDSVSYTYPLSNTIALDSITFNIEPGKHIVITGESGSGKSTLLKLLAGLYLPTKGKIVYDDRVSNLSMIWQEPYLFNVSVFDNLVVGADLSTAKVRAIASKVNMDSTIMRLPYGYKSNVTDGGQNFSGGEKRRLAIARALLTNPNLLIFDEPTAGLDDANALSIWQMISELGPNVTKIVTTHRIEEAKKADVVLVLRDGKLIKCGSPDELTT